MRKAKIVATIGPASEKPEMIRELLKAGMDVARLNFSHGTLEEHARRIRSLRAVAAAAGQSLPLLQDLPGPKIRTGRLRGRRPVMLEAGGTVRLTPGDILGSAARLSINYPNLAREVRRGDRILLSDGLIELRVRGSSGGEVICGIENGGLLGEHKGVNLPGVKLRIPALTPRDEEYLKFGLEQDVDYVALSFVRRAGDVHAAKRIIAAARKQTPVIAKLEKPEALENIDRILTEADGVMIARGDLGVEMPPEKVPVAQKWLIERAGAAKVPVITATQMLESMTLNPRPTRAEASDVANAVFDGSDALMLSAETAAGSYPREAVAMMARIIADAEQHMQERGWWRRPTRENTIAETISESVAHATDALGVKALVVFTWSGSTARLVSKYRPSCPIYAFCHSDEVRRRVALYWGTRSRFMPLVTDTDTTVTNAQRLLLEEKCVEPGDIVAVVAGSPFGCAGGTNLMKLLRVEP
jgi:pyruvate kinase